MKNTINSFRLKPYVFYPRIGRNKGAVIFGKKTFILGGRKLDLFKKFESFGPLLDKIQTLPFSKKKNFLQFVKIGQANGFLFSPRLNANSNPQLVSVSSAINAINEAVEMWKTLPQNHEMYDELESGNPDVVASYLIERAYFVYSTPHIISLAVKNSPTKPLRLALTQYATHEQDHDLLLLNDLGLTRKTLLQHDPTPGTRLLLAHLLSLAIEDPLSFCVTTNLLETQHGIMQKLTKFYKGLGKIINKPLPGFILHHKEDVKQKHRSLHEVVLQNYSPLTEERVSKFLQDLHVTKHAIIYWQDSMYYRFSTVRNLSQKIGFSIENYIRPRPELNGFKQP